MMGVEAPEIFWATHKRQVINLWNCCIWLVNLFQLYDDARTCQRQICGLSSYFASFTAIVYLFLSFLFRDMTSIYHQVQLSPFYFSNNLVFWIYLRVNFLLCISIALIILHASNCFYLPSMFHSHFTCTFCFPRTFLNTDMAYYGYSYSESPSTHSGCRDCHAFIPAFTNKFNNSYSRNV